MGKKQGKKIHLVRTETNLHLLWDISLEKMSKTIGDMNVGLSPPKKYKQILIDNSMYYKGSIK